MDLSVKNINTAEKLRAIFKFLDEEQINALMTEGEKLLDIIEEATINASVLGRAYGGRVDMRPHYRAFGEAIAAKGPFRSFQISPSTAYAVAGLVIQLEPQIFAALCEDFGTDEPPILPPIIAEDNTGETSPDITESAPTDDTGSEPQ